MFIIRGVHVYPSHIDEILSRYHQLGSEYQIHISHGADGKDYMSVNVEASDSGIDTQSSQLAKDIKNAIRKGTLVSCKFEISAYGTMPRTERKSKRVFDYRE